MFEGSILQPLERFSNAILITSIIIDLTFEIAKNVKPNSQFLYFGKAILVDNLVCHFATLVGIFFDSLQYLNQNYPFNIFVFYY
jgi:hypothetical protein